MATKSKPNNKNLKALFSIICLCIVALGLIVYFSTQSNSTDVNEPTTVTESTTEVQNRVTVQESTTKDDTESTSEETTKKESTTQSTTMELSDTNTPYKSFYKYPAGETAILGYSEELVKNETMGDYRAHTAIDFKCEQGSDIVAINDGLVLNVYKDDLLGNVVEIDHGGTLTARYCGLDSIYVSQGDFVAIGQTIGTLGTVPFESSSTSHLHFETLFDGAYVNPLDVMSKTD